MAMTQHDSGLHNPMHDPIGHLVGILRDGQMAEHAAWSLYEAGYTDVLVLDAHPAVESIETKERTATALAHAWARLSAHLLEDADARQEALGALSQGHAIVLVSASGGAQEDQAESILRSHGARALHYFGRWSFTEVGR
jgi:hypothetical protein